MEISGTIKELKQTQQVSASFQKRELVITTDEQYPQQIMIEFVQDKTDLLNGYKVGESVKVGINLQGREWINPQGEAKYFNSIKGWRIEKDQTTAQTPSKSFTPAPSFTEEEHDDLPF